MFNKIASLVLFTFITLPVFSADISPTAKKTAEYAVQTYQASMVASLTELVKYNTLAVDGVSANNNPEHIAFKAELKKQAEDLGFDYTDDGYVVVIGLGESKERVGIITHGDIQPVNPKKWQKSPFELDTTSEPGKLIARGTEDDKGPISTALYAMKAIKDKNIKLNKRIELYVYMAEESDWGPLQEYIKTHTLPQTNITIDAEYPVVTAEKGYGTIKIAFNKNNYTGFDAYISEFSGGFFGSQIPEDAKAVIANADMTLLQQMMDKARDYQGVSFDFLLKETQLTVTALGKSAHSSKPQEGVNAIPFLADLLSQTRWPSNGAGTLVNFINDNIGLGLEGKKFGNIAYSDDFMGPMTVSPTVIKQLKNNIELNINIRRPRGKSAQQLTEEINHVIATWKLTNMADITELEHYIGDPFVQKDAPHIETLLAVFSHFTGIKDAKPIAIGGGTNSRLFPNAVSFGPSMPNANYTGHSEHEFITMKQFVLNLKMYTAALVEMAAAKAQ
ncbi:MULTISPECIES: dipeptidase [unclassified Colwellia]|uniref:dipeptidase n=1 Tax=unclassified Colwellia TaxID=196834 RepID=UPI0015F60568|nr:MULTISPECIES: dipeptidase [unclassified Colwellia]MBA6231838.1 dipeptidase [Colwellia sp. MB02u-7]MBA6235793.1 dipeptidase [Colwellia sp. MB02u-11]MBA6254962.1 dipeptidase [Colwellia sp. MB3u-28]MBA6259087.1 dipeptidase [Colwellia sp. MB3u-41]MBA6298882.1 dipeptidase [Colwellia sp. MB3u-22]